VVISSPRTGATVAGPITVSGTATRRLRDPVSWVDLYVDGDYATGCDGTASWTCQWDTESVPPGTHTLRANAVDEAGRSGWSATISVKVGPSQPTITIAAPAAGQQVSGVVHLSGALTTRVASTEDDLDIVVDDGWDVSAFVALGPSPVGSVNWSYDLDLGDLAPGDHTITVTLADDSFRSATASVQVTVTG
jgi:hypothetical protein